MKLFSVSSLVLSGALVFFSGCSSLTKFFLKAPEVKILDVKVTDISMADISVDVIMNVKNPNRAGLNLDSVTYELSLSGETVTEGTYSKAINVPASGQQNVTVPLKFKFKSFGNILTGLMNRSFTKQYELNGRAQLGIFSIPFSQKGEVKLNK